MLQNILFMENKECVRNGLTRIHQNGVPQQELCKDKYKHFTNQYKVLLIKMYLTILSITRGLHLQTLRKGEVEKTSMTV
jgi:hypothetical protein